jgi:hypothetical protein
MSAAIGWGAETGKASVNDHEIALGHDHVVLVFQRVRQTLNESEESVASGGNVGTVLNVIRGPEPFRRRVLLNRVSNASRTMALFFAAVDLLILPSLPWCMSSASAFGSIDRFLIFAALSKQESWPMLDEQSGLLL